MLPEFCLFHDASLGVITEVIIDDNNYNSLLNVLGTFVHNR